MDQAYTKRYDHFYSSSKTIKRPSSKSNPFFICFQTTIDLANKSTVYLRQINLNSAKNMQKAVNNQLNSGANKSDVSESNGSNLSEGLTGGSQFVDYKVSAGQITPCPWSCPHCSGVIIEPISLACGHTYCRYELPFLPVQTLDILNRKQPQ